MTWFLVALAVLSLVVALPFYLEARRRMPDPKTAPGKFADLSQGRTHYRWIGPVRGPVLVAIHGLSTPSPVWQAVAGGLGQTGYRVLVYDLYGRGHSGNASGAQDAGFFLRQLEDLLDHEGLAEDLTLMGFSMGGAIATAFAAAHPDRMKRLIVLAPTGVMLREGALDRFIRQVPGIGDWLFRLVEPFRMRAPRLASGAASEVPGIRDVQIAQTRRRGYFPAVLSSRRGMMTARQEAEYRSIGKAGVPVVALWGKEDDQIPLRALGVLAEWDRLARQEVIAGAGHGLPHTHATAVVKVLRDVLREPD